MVEQLQAHGKNVLGVIWAKSAHQNIGIGVRPGVLNSDILKPESLSKALPFECIQSEQISAATSDTENKPKCPRLARLGQEQQR